VPSDLFEHEGHDAYQELGPQASSESGASGVVLTVVAAGRVPRGRLRQIWSRDLLRDRARLGTSLASPGPRMDHGAPLRRLPGRPAPAVRGRDARPLRELTWPCECCPHDQTSPTRTEIALQPTPPSLSAHQRTAFPIAHRRLHPNNHHRPRPPAGSFVLPGGVRRATYEALSRPLGPVHLAAWKTLGPVGGPCRSWVQPRDLW
jgi:hypothetical protein